MEEKKLTEKESLELISAMIARTKERYMLGDGNIMLLWGYLTVVVSVAIWILLAVTHNPVWNWLWFLIWIIGGIVTPVMARRKQQKFGVRTYSDKLSSRIWSAVGYSAIASTFFCLGFMLFKGIDAWPMMFAFALVIVPFAEIVQGVVLDEKALMTGGALGVLAGIFTLCCIAGRVPLYVIWFMPVFIAAFACMMIIPGHILNHKARRQNDERA